MHAGHEVAVHIILLRDLLCEQIAEGKGVFILIYCRDIFFRPVRICGDAVKESRFGEGFVTIFFPDQVAAAEQRVLVVAGIAGHEVRRIDFIGSVGGCEGAQGRRIGIVVERGAVEAVHQAFICVKIVFGGSDPVKSRVLIGEIADRFEGDIAVDGIAEMLFGQIEAQVQRVVAHDEDFRGSKDEKRGRQEPLQCAVRARLHFNAEGGDAKCNQHQSVDQDPCGAKNHCAPRELKVQGIRCKVQNQPGDSGKYDCRGTGEEEALPVRTGQEFFQEKCDRHGDQQRDPEGEAHGQRIHIENVTEARKQQRGHTGSGDEQGANPCLSLIQQVEKCKQKERADGQHGDLIVIVRSLVSVPDPGQVLRKQAGNAGIQHVGPRAGAEQRKKGSRGVSRAHGTEKVSRDGDDGDGGHNESCSCRQGRQQISAQEFAETVTDQQGSHRQINDDKDSRHIAEEITAVEVDGQNSGEGEKTGQRALPDKCLDGEHGEREHGQADAVAQVLAPQDGIPGVCKQEAGDHGSGGVIREKQKKTPCGKGT